MVFGGLGGGIGGGPSHQWTTGSWKGQLYAMNQVIQPHRKFNCLNSIPYLGARSQRNATFSKETMANVTSKIRKIEQQYSAQNVCTFK